VPKFCRHNRLLQNCPICSREEAVELRPILSSSSPRIAEPRPPADGPRSRSERSPRPTLKRGVTVRHLRSAVDDGYRSPLVPGLKSSEEARRLAEELAFSATRFRLLAEDPPGLYAEVGDGGADIEERTWLAFLIAYLGPLEGEDPFTAIRGARTSWASGEELALDGVQTGPLTAHDPERGTRTIEAYRAWVLRAGSQAAAFAAEPGWGAERRFARVFERLALPGLHRGARFELLLTLGRLGVYDMTAGALGIGGTDPVTLAAKRALAIGDPLLLERRAAQLAEACGVPLAALDLALYNWEQGERASGGLPTGSVPGASELDGARSALEV
jgi:hypothetical protein